MCGEQWSTEEGEREEGRGRGIVPEDEEHLWEVLPDPRARFILVLDRIHPQLGAERIQLRSAACVSHAPQGLRERVGTAPDGNPQGTRVCAVNCIDEKLRTRRPLSVIESGYSIHCRSRGHLYGKRSVNWKDGETGKKREGWTRTLLDR